MADVFISYSRRDQEYVKRLAGFFQEADLSVWLDLTDIRTGDKWKQEIVDGIEECSAFVVVMSPSSLGSESVGKELNLAENREKPIFPLLLEGECFPLLQDTQWEDVRGQQMPRKSLLVTLARTCRADEKFADGSSRKRAADLRLLHDLWKLINTSVLRELREKLPVARVKADQYQETIVAYNHTRILNSEMHFLSYSLENEFLELDRLLEEFKNDLWSVASQVIIDGELRIIPDFMFNAFFVTPKLTDADRYEKKRRFDEALSKLDSVIEQQQRIVMCIRAEFPEFRFESSTS